MVFGCVAFCFVQLFLYGIYPPCSILPSLSFSLSSSSIIHRFLLLLASIFDTRSVVFFPHSLGIYRLFLYILFFLKTFLGL
ncbi:hypothetical protein BC829DRAFT_380959 [Chytridium lagenaria]|nr:hypothetical protein BC829DRAFT_380959 [Chytridium lagenaria]